MSTERVEGEDEPFDDDRDLCPDGACVGLLGPDGRCKVCGKEAPARPAAAAAAVAAPSPAAPPQRKDAAEPASATASADDTDDDEDRELCPDGTCIGLIGPDGRCKVCGSKADSASP
jgi:hypothetical protein